MELTARPRNRVGAILVICSAIVFSLAGVFVKGVSAGTWEVVFWRGIFSAGFILAYVLWHGNFKSEFMNMGKSGWAVALIGAAASVCFISAFKFSPIANVILIYASAPILAAIFAWFWIGERLDTKTVLACLFAFIGVGTIMYNSLGTFNFKGNILALGMTLGMALMMVIYRRWPQMPAGGPMALSSILLLTPGFMLGDVFSIPLQEIFILALFGASFAIASVCLAEGMRRLPAGEAALLSILETPLAPIFGFIFFAEIPALSTFVGGIMIISAVIWSQTA